MKNRVIPALLIVLLAAQTAHASKQPAWLSPVVGGFIGLLVAGIIDQSLPENTKKEPMYKKGRGLLIAGSALLGGWMSYLAFGAGQSPSTSNPTAPPATTLPATQVATENQPQGDTLIVNGKKTSIPATASNFNKVAIDLIRNQGFNKTSNNRTTSSAFTRVHPVPTAPKVEKFSGAGILPLFERNGEIYALLSREAGGQYDQGTYDAFSGSRDGTETPAETAARECCEESISQGTMNISLEDMKERIKRDTRYLAEWYDKDKKHHHFTYLLEFSLKRIQMLINNFYNQRSKQKSWHSMEKDCLALVRFEDLKSAAANANNYGQVYINSAILIDPQTNQELPGQTIRIRPVFAKSISGKRVLSKSGNSVYFESTITPSF